MSPLVLEKKARAFRNHHGLGSDDAIRLKSLLYKLNVLTVFRPLTDGISGMAIKITGPGQVTSRFILINSNKTLGHQHFTICHELYHLYIQENFERRVCLTGKFEKKDIEEYRADVFAAHLLLPEDGVKALIPDDELRRDAIRLPTLLKIEQYFSCSRSALLYRLKNLEIISEQKLETFSSSVKKSAVQFGFTTGIYEPGNHNEVIGDYGTIARELFDREKISESHYLSLLHDLGMNPTEIQDLEKVTDNGDDG